MYVIIYYGMRYNMVSSRLKKEMHNICKLFQKHNIQTVREGVYFFQLYDMNHLANIRIVEDLSNRILQLKQKITELGEK